MERKDLALGSEQEEVQITDKFLDGIIKEGSEEVIVGTPAGCDMQNCQKTAAGRRS